MEQQDKFIPSECEAELLGFISEAELLLLEKVYGGQTVYIHRDPTDDMIELLGKEPAQRLSKYFGVSWIYIPKCLYRFERNKQIYKEINSGTNLKDLAAKFKLKTPAIRVMLRNKYGFSVTGSKKPKE